MMICWRCCVRRRGSASRFQHAKTRSWSCMCESPKGIFSPPHHSLAGEIFLYNSEFYRFCWIFRGITKNFLVAASIYRSNTAVFRRLFVNVLWRQLMICTTHALSWEKDAPRASGDLAALGSIAPLRCCSCYVKKKFSWSGARVWIIVLGTLFQKNGRWQDLNSDGIFNDLSK